jgi:hypothetical protein
MKRLVLFVEGEGESDAAPRLIKRLLDEHNAWDVLWLDENPFRVGEVTRLLKDDSREWKRKLAASAKRSSLGGVLLILDGDLRSIGQRAFCTAEVARSLAQESRTVGGGAEFSVAIVFARQEFESWLIAGFESLAGKLLPDGRRIAACEQHRPPPNTEDGPRDAKGWLSKAIDGGYKPTRDQALLTNLVDLAVIRDRRIRSFLRLESAVSALVNAIRSGVHTVSP